MEENMGNQTAIEQPESVEKLNDEIEATETSIIEKNELETEIEIVSNVNEIENVSLEAPTIENDGASKEDLQDLEKGNVPNNESIEIEQPVVSEISEIIETENSSPEAYEAESDITSDIINDVKETNIAVEETDNSQSITIEVASESNTQNTPSIVEEISPVSDLLESDSFEKLEEELPHEKIDYSQLSKNELISLLDKAYLKINIDQPASQDIKQADSLLNEIRPIFNGFKIEDRKEALKHFLLENESEDGFEYKETEENQKFDNLFKKIKEVKHNHFKEIEKNKEKNFALKTELLNQLRTLADTESGELSTIKANILTLKKLQQEWKEAGNLAGPHNNTLWQTYHALVDRFYSNRGIYFELLELDRKKNLNQKIELCTKVEALAEKLKNEELTNKILQEVSHIYDEYKHIGPAPKEANELIWQRFKGALDVIYDKRRSQNEALKGVYEENLAAKQQILDSLAIFTSFRSESINEWMEQTKAIDIIQKQWDNIKGPLPKDKSKDINKDFWHGIKQFYKNKNDFFKALEAKREENLKQKQQLCEQAEAFASTEEDSPEITKAVIKLQEDWRKIGHVPDKFRNKIYERFKAACDAYFNKKRQKTSESEKEFIENLAQKIALCEKIESQAKTGADLSQLPEIKKEWAAIGFVPKAEMQAIQKRYINAINNYVGALGKLSDKEKEKLSLQTEVEVFKQKDNSNSKDLGRKEMDIRAKIQHLENDLSTLKNNLEFFARSKNADKLKAEFEQKIKKGEDDLAHMKHQLKVVRQASE